MWFFIVSQLKFISEKVLQNQNFIDGFFDGATCYNKRVIFYQPIKTEIHYNLILAELVSTFQYNQ